MAKIVVLGAGIGGMPAAFELKSTLGEQHEVTLINASTHFQFTPSNPWVMVGWRKPDQIQIPIEPAMRRKNIRFIAQKVARIDAARNQLELANGSTEAYDYLVICTGAQLAFDEIPGTGPDGHTHSVCTTPHAERAAQAYQQFLRDPGPIVVGAAQGASCFGPAYEIAMILDADLRKRKLRDRVPMTFVTSEPYIGHMGLGGVGDSKTLLESELRKRHISWITNAKIQEATSTSVRVLEHDASGQALKEHELPSRFSAFIPAFRGVDALANVEGLCNPRGFVLIDEHQRNPTWRNIFGVGVCVAIPPVESTPIPTGAPKTGYMIESMTTAVTHNIAADITGGSADARPTWDAVCLADLGDNGFVFVAQPQIPPRNITWSKRGKWVHLAKIAFEKYFLHKMKRGNPETAFEKFMLKSVGIKRLKS